MDASGNRVWLEATYMPIFAEGTRKVIGVLKIATDITNRQNSIVQVADDLKQMSAELFNRSEAGITRSEELGETIKTNCQRFTGKCRKFGKITKSDGLH